MGRRLRRVSRGGAQLLDQLLLLLRLLRLLLHQQSHLCQLLLQRGAILRCHSLRLCCGCVCLLRHKCVPVGCVLCRLLLLLLLLLPCLYQLRVLPAEARHRFPRRLLLAAPLDLELLPAAQFADAEDALRHVCWRAIDWRHHVAMSGEESR